MAGEGEYSGACRWGTKAAWSQRGRRQPDHKGDEGSLVTRVMKTAFSLGERLWMTASSVMGGTDTSTRIL